MKKYLKKEQYLLKEVEDLISNESYHPDHSDRMLEVNVKLHRLNFLDNDDICEGIDKGKYGKLTKEQKERVKERWLGMNGDEYPNTFSFFTDYEYEYFKEVIGGCTNNSYEHYQERIMAVYMNQDTCYPDIDKIKDIKGRIRELRKWQKRDVKEKKYYDKIDLKNFGLYGRGGGHLCYYRVRDLENVIEELESLIEEYFDEKLNFNKDGRASYRDIMHGIKNDYEGLKFTIEALAFAKKEIEEAFNGLPEAWKHEVKYWLEEEIIPKIIKESEEVAA